MSKTDFLSWDNDIDLDALLGEYTEDDDRDKLLAKTSKKDASVEGYKCPICVLRLLPDSVAMCLNNMTNLILKVNN